MEMLQKTKSFFQRLWAILSRRDESGQGLFEYGLILDLIAVITILAILATRVPANDIRKFLGALYA